MNTARLHWTPADALGGMVRHSAVVHGRAYQYDRPVGLEKLFDHPAVQAAFNADEYIPYWADLWPAASMLAEAILKEPWAPRTATTGLLQAIELGCGLGLSGIVALECGLHVTFTDVDAAAVQLAAHNARLNGYTEFETATVDIRATPDRHWPVILAADVLYEARMLEPLVQFLRQAMPPNGIALVGDADRISARPFRGMLDDAGFLVITTVAKTGARGSQTRGVVYRITWPERD